MVEKRKRREFLKEIPQCPSLETLLWAMNGMEKCKVFTKLEFDKDGYIKKTFTNKGAELYKRLVDLVYAVCELTDSDDGEHIVENLDMIVRNEY